MKKIGWFCAYTPIEILHAAGFLPVGIKSDSGAEHEDVILGDAMCSYVRSCMGGALAGVYDDLSGVVITHSCECMRRLADGWVYQQAEIKPKMQYLLDVPKIVTDASISFFAGGIRHMKESLEAQFHPISDDAVRNAIETYAVTRTLFSEIDTLRKNMATAVTGQEVAALIEKSFEIPREAFNALLKDFIQSKAKARGDADIPRIMLIGGPGNSSLISTIENSGGLCVLEHMCSGLRLFAGKRIPHSDPYHELAALYLTKTPCPRMLGEKSREAFKEIQAMVADYQVDGIIYYSMKFCANMMIQWAFLKNDIPLDVPIKVIEGDIRSTVNTREIQSFIKRLKKRRKKNHE